MNMIVFFVVVIGIVLVIASGIWVAIALIRAVSRRGTETSVQCQAGQKSDNYNT